MALFSLFQVWGGGGATTKNTRKKRKDQKIALLKPLSTIFVPCMKIWGGGARPPPALSCRRPYT